MLATRYWDEQGTAPVVTARGTGELVYRTVRSVLRGHPGDAAWRLGERAGLHSDATR